MQNRLIFAAGVAALGSIASADVAISTFTFSDLNSEYFTQDGVTGYFTARAGGDTSGDVTRVNMPVAQTAEYSPAFANDDASLADVVFEMSVSNITALSADASGSFTITDVDGDTIGGNLDGTWLRATAGAPILFFNGTLTGVAFTASGDGMFEGTDGAGFEFTPFLLGNLFSGGVVQVSFGLDTFFNQSFAGFNSQFSGTIVPTPGAAALLLGAGGVYIRRRR
ncbi:MAG: hypothetical protein H6810_03635 [Phycisphaeraceae bacterium]|nr:MAG: hypothetical protein H6810_03635 [Phycisphaeraceae bacterium]